MKTFQNCSKDIDENGRYLCLVLGAVRDSRDEEICSICPFLCETLEKKMKVHKAFYFAAQAHQGQYRKGTDIPYLIHLIRTWNYVRQMTEDDMELAAALLHDVLEDTKVTEKELEEQFGRELAELVAGESEYKREERPAGETWQIRKQETIERLKQRAKQENELASMHIAFADKLANLYSMMFEYCRVGEQLWSKFNQKDKRKHAWYYGEMERIFTQYFRKSEPELVREYQKYYKEIFGEYEV